MDKTCKQIWKEINGSMAIELASGISNNSKPTGYPSKSWH